MEKLQPIIKQRFWILIVIALITTVVGWKMSVSTMAATIVARKGAIDAAFKKIPADAVPNDSETKLLSAINEQQEKEVADAALTLWKKQEKTMFWPKQMEQFIAKTTYRGPLDALALDTYRTNYLNNARQTWRIINPLDPLTGEGIVDYPFAGMGQRLFSEQLPKIEDVWNAQEDLWLHASLFDSILRINGGPKAQRADAVVHRIEELKLRGGNKRQAPAAPAGAPGGGGSGDPSASAGFNFGGGPGGGTALTSDFNPSEELGDDAQAGGAAPGGLPGGVIDPSANFKRYVDEDPAMPFKTRGFYMTVIMDNRQLPKLLSGLTSHDDMAWPVEILRVQVVRMNADVGLVTTGGGGGGGGGGISFVRPATPAGNPGLSDSEFSTEGSPTGSATDAANAMAAYGAALQDPYMSRVSLCGVIYLYNPPKEDPNKPKPPTPAPAVPAAPAVSPAAPTLPAAATGPAGAVPAPTTLPATTPGTEPATTTPPTDTPKPAGEPAPDGTPEKPAPAPDTKDPPAATGS